MMNREMKAFLLTTVLVLGLTPLASAHPRYEPCRSGNAKHHHSNDRNMRDDAYHLNHYQGVFSKAQRNLLDDLWRGRAPVVWSDDYRDRVISQRRIPPGVLRNLQRGKPLPPGLARKYSDVPASTYRYLGIPYGSPYRVVVLDRNVVSYDRASGIVRDILWNVF